MAAHVTASVLDLAGAAPPSVGSEPLALNDASFGATEAIARWKYEIADGQPWSNALLRAVGAWPLADEVHEGREFTYLIAGEAFDWLLLAERLMLEAGDAVPREEQSALLFHGQLPDGLSDARFQEALGVAKYRAHLNFFYGVVVEEALWHAIECEVLKQRTVRGLAHSNGVDDMVAEKLYGCRYQTLLGGFHRDQGRRPRIKHRLSDWKAFTYWCFQRRLASSDRTRTASDTQKGLAMLREIASA